MQQQVTKRSMPSDLGWSSGADGGWTQQNSIAGSGSWTSTASQDSMNSASSSWQGVSKSETASDPSDDVASSKSGSTVTNVSSITGQSQDSVSTSSATALQATSSSPWNASNVKLSGIDSSPWGSSSSPNPTGMGWSPNPSSLSSNQGHNNGTQSGANIIGSNSVFNPIGSAGSSTGWPTSITGNTSSLQPSMNSNLSSQWQGGSVLGSNGDFTKSSDSSWNNSTSSILDSTKDLGTNSDQRLWGFSSDKPVDSQWDTTKSQWGNSALSGGGGDQGANNTELSFAQATLKGLKVLPAASAPQAAINSRHEEILRAIENHEGWGSRPIRQDTSWEVDTSPKSHRKFSTDGNAGASNVWNNSNGTAIWEAVRENQSSWSAGAPGGNSWNADKEQPGWAGPAKPPQDSTNWNVGNNADPKVYGTWGATGGAGDATNKMWGQKTEIGSWGDPGVQRSTSISSWGDDGDTGSWEDQRRIASGLGGVQVMVPPSPGISTPASIPGMVGQGLSGVGMAAIGADVTPWNESLKPGWSSVNAAAVTRTNSDEPWNKPPPTRTGWGDPGQDSAEIDNGTGIWASSVPKQLPTQAKVPSWGDTGPQGQWNAAVGAKPKVPPGWEDPAWAMAQRAKQMPQKYMGSGSNPPTQMRAKLLQHLMDMGFRKEEAQSALITNNLNLEMAINDLKSGNVNISRKDLDMDVFQANGSQSRLPFMSKGGVGGDEMPDIRPDQVPNFNNLQNTLFPNAQISNQPFMQSNASLNPSGSSINSSLQQKLMQKMQQQQAPPATNLSQRGPVPPVGNGTGNQVLQQQQQQILAQLRQAVSNGFISPQLLNYQLPHNILVLLQQLLQLQSALQTFMSKQQQMMQQARATGSRSNPQLEQLPGIISNINQQIINVQKQLQQAQNNLFNSQKPPNLTQPPAGTVVSQPGVSMDSLDALSTDLANVALQSRLTTQWKPSPETASVATDNTGTPITAATATIKAGDENIENKAPGSKGVLQSSSPNLNLIPGGLGMTGDKTWSSNMSATSSSNWPLSSTESQGTTSQADLKAPSSISSPSSLLSGLHSGLSDVIPEFVPGKPWQGLTKSVEDDPHVTPGSIQLQRSLSVNRVHDDSLSNLDVHKLANSPWGTSLKNDSLGLSQLGSRPPPSMGISKGVGGPQWQAGSFNRQTSWPHSSNSAFTKVTASSWNDSTPAFSSWILLRNLTVDPNTARALCAQHGTLVSFYPLAQGQIALVQYGSRDIAFGAQQRLNNFQMGSSVITTEFISESDAQRYAAASQLPPQPSSLPPINASPWSQAPPSTSFPNAGVRGGDPWSSSLPGAQGNSKFGSTGENLWGLWDRSDHNSNPLSGILGGESM